jgi:protein SCO1
VLLLMRAWPTIRGVRAPRGAKAAQYELLGAIPAAFIEKARRSIADRSHGASLRHAASAMLLVKAMLLRRPLRAPERPGYSGPIMGKAGFAFLCVVSTLACNRAQPPAKEYPLHGQVLAVRAERQEIVIRHGDIKDFMPGMTMPFRVKDPRVLRAAAAGDLVDATLVVRGGDAWLSRVTPTGTREPLPADAVTPHRMDPPLEPGAVVPDTSFMDQDGRTLRTASLRGRPWALTFVYTRCPLPTFCPALDRRFQTVQGAIAGDARLRGVQLVSVSIDPAFDRPPVLKAHAARLGADPHIWRFVTGETDAVDRFGERFGLTVVRGGGRPEEFVHSMKTAVIDASGRLHRLYAGTEWAAQQLVSDLREAVR